MYKKIIIAVVTILIILIGITDFAIFQKNWHEGEIVPVTDEVDVEYENISNENTILNEADLYVAKMVVAPFREVAINNSDEDLNRVQSNIEEYLEVKNVDTSEWKTYENKEFGFQVDYPYWWEYEEQHDGFMGTGDDIVDCTKSPWVCSIVVFHDEKDNGHDYITIRNTQGYKDWKKNKKISEWTNGLVVGCEMIGLRKMDEKTFIFHSFYGATDINNETISHKEKALCENGDVGPYFDEIMKSFRKISQ